MNKDVMSFHLGEASEQLNQLLVSLQSNEAMDEAELRIDFAHLYSHLNTAWNARNANEDYWTSLSEDQFYRDRLFPHDIQDYLT